MHDPLGNTDLQRAEGAEVATPKDEAVFPLERVEDQFAVSLAKMLAGQPYKVKRNVQLRNFDAVTPRGRVTRTFRVKVDFLMIAEYTCEPLLGIRLTNVTYGRDRRQAPKREPYTSLIRGSMLIVLDVDPYQGLEKDTLIEALNRQ
ncbi:hypothetical protein [Deinococcus hopiensis]|uniref:Uncharacterized protein n=1 Tax=Deinococcus hopiensis KR-140 TaxID=695939 RepID=A0A1W1UUD5_9DEIO|nr:hypothetical protein [Deinococcus hopiensis]SMB84745.1 hypothetical protein SAMN00790413_05269 [Deinococcus hopiensis KR-140]